jgi:hypothetical protein
MRMLAMIYRVLLASSWIVYASELKMLTLNLVPNKLDVPWFLEVQKSMSFELDPFSLKVINFLQVRTLAILQLAILENQKSGNLDRQMLHDRFSKCGRYECG